MATLKTKSGKIFKNRNQYANAVLISGSFEVDEELRTGTPLYLDEVSLNSFKSESNYGIFVIANPYLSYNEIRGNCYCINKDNIRLLTN